MKNNAHHPDVCPKQKLLCKEGIEIMDFEEVHKNAEEIRRILRLRTYPLAIKMLKSEADVPEKAKRPGWLVERIK